MPSELEAIRTRHLRGLSRGLAGVLLVCVSTGSPALSDDPGVPTRESLEAILRGPFAERASVEHVKSMGRPVTTTLTEIAEDERAGTVLRMSAIRMLGLLPWEWSHGALATTSALGDPFLRCMSLQSAVASGARNSIPMLVESLDDGAVCMKTIGCPGGAFEATVADEAVRLLDGLVPREELDRRPLDSCSHSDATPWKAWWKNRHSEKRAVGEDAD